MLLLAHPVIPHHHHETTGICFHRHCYDSKEAHRHENHASQTHQHEGNPSADKCSLDHVCTPTDNHKKMACCSQITCDCGQLNYILITNHLHIQDFVENAKKTYRLTPCISSFHTDFIVQSLGLRAPPC